MVRKPYPLRIPENLLSLRDSKCSRTPWTQTAMLGP